MQMVIKEIKLARRKGFLDLDLSVSFDGARWFDTSLRRGISALGQEFMDLWPNRNSLAKYCPELEEFSAEVVRMCLGHRISEDGSSSISSLAITFKCSLLSFERDFRVEMPALLANELIQEDLDVLQKMTGLIATAIASDQEV